MQKKSLVRAARSLNEEMPVLFLFVTSVIAAVVLVIHTHDYEALNGVPKTNRLAIVKAPNSVPPLSQESVNKALIMFNIEVPEGVLHPIFDEELEDRGLTTLRGWGASLEVSVGPAAFSSWGLLGSTLAHELEVHCRQNFTLIRTLDLLGMKGTEAAEREAYLHELENASRFNLGEQDRLNIQATMDFYYPLKEGGSLTAR